jgi:hypothetical protein
MVAEQAQGGAPEDVGVEPLLSVLVLEGLLPVEGRELEDTTDRPAQPLGRPPLTDHRRRSGWGDVIVVDGEV